MVIGETSIPDNQGRSKESMNFAPPKDYLVSNGITGEGPFSIFSADFNNDGLIQIKNEFFNCDDSKNYFRLKYYPIHSIENVKADGVDLISNDYCLNYLTGVLTFKKIPTSTLYVDYTHSINMDIVTSNWSVSDNFDSMSIILNNDDGTFGDYTSYRIGEYGYCVFGGDFNGDKYIDVVTTNAFANTISILFNKGNGKFEKSTDYKAGEYPKSVFTSDFNGNSYLDIVVANLHSDTITVYYNDGNGKFDSSKNYLADGPSAVCASDFDGDGDMDIATANTINDTVSIFLNKGNKTFTSHVDYTVCDKKLPPHEPNPCAIFATDLDGDNDIDISTANWLSNSVSILKNKGDGTFNLPTEYYWGGDLGCSIFANDFDDDGDEDLVTPNDNPNFITILQNNGYGIFTSFKNIEVHESITSIFSIDLDGDYDFDIVTANSNLNNISVILNELREPTDLPPQCDIYYPIEDSIVNGTITIKGNAFDREGTLQKVEIAIDDETFETNKLMVEGLESWTAKWNTSQYSDNKHTIYAKSFDGFNYSSIIWINVTVDNFQNQSPICTISYPAENVLINEIINISGTALDDEENITIIDVSIDDETFSTNKLYVEGLDDWSAEWDTTQYSNGNHVIYARAFDGELFSNIVSINVRINQRPLVKVTKPMDGEIITGLFPIKGIASDDLAVKKVEIKIDNRLWKSVNGIEIWNFSWDTTLENNGNHTISIRAFDEELCSQITTIKVVINNTINYPPIIINITANPPKIQPDEKSLITVNAVDPNNNDSLFYIFNVTNGYIIGSGSIVTWHAPNIEGHYLLTIIVKDQTGEESKGTITIIVQKNKNPNSDKKEMDLEFGINILIFLIILIIISLIVKKYRTYMNKINRKNKLKHIEVEPIEIIDDDNN